MRMPRSRQMIEGKGFSFMETKGWQKGELVGITHMSIRFDSPLAE